MPTAVEEFLRAYAPVTMARLVARDHDFHGCPMKEGDWVLLPFPAANRDPEEFPAADRVIIDPPRIAMLRSDWASTGAWDRTSPAWSCRRRSRSG